MNKEKKVNLIMAIIMSACMGILFAFVARKNAAPQALQSMPPAPIMVLTSLIESIIVGVIVAFVIPMGKMGMALSSKFGARPGTFKFTAINSIPFAVINAVLVSAVCSFISIAKSHASMPSDQAPPLLVMWLANWLKTLPLSILVGYILAIIISPIVVRSVGLGGPPDGKLGPPQGKNSSEEPPKEQ